MARLIVQGKRRLSGRHRASGNKNAVLPMLAASVLTDEPVQLQNIPLIEDVRTMLDLLATLGADVALRGHGVSVCTRGIRRRRLDPALCRRVRASILFAGPMAARHGRVTVFPPGGDVIGRRRLDAHFDGLRRLGIEVNGRNRYHFRRNRLQGARILLDEASVTATGNVVMAAVLAPGETSIFNAACEPHVQDLCRLLNAMGAAITGIGTNLLRIRGVPVLGGARHRVAPDYVDTASFLAAAAVTRGEIAVSDAPPPEDMAVVERAFAKLGVRWVRENGVLRPAPKQSFRVRDDFGSAIPKIDDGPWPGFPSDLMSVAIVLATQARGTVLFFEKMFESRMYFVDRLIEMGAKIVQCDPHRVIVTGPARLHGIHMSSPDIRAGMALVLAALAASGESIIDQADSIDRGYEHIEQALRRLGADITREP